MSNTFFKKVTSAVSVAALALTAVSSTLTANAGSEFAKYADAMAKAGYISVQSNEAGYRLDAKITRAEMAKIAVNIAKVETKECAGTVYSDVSSKLGDLCKFVEAAADAGLVSKANKTFRPTDLVTRAEMVKMLLGALKVTPVSESQGFSDVGASLGDLAGYINAAAKAGIVNKADLFRPNATSTRGEAFKVAAKAANLEIATDDTSSEDLCKLLGIGCDDTTNTGTTNTGTTNTGVVVKSGDVEVALNPETPTGNIAADATRVAMMAFDVTAGKEDITLKDLDLKFTGAGDADNITSLSVYLNNTKVTKQDSENFDSENLAELTFIKNFVIKAGETQKLVVAANTSTGAADSLQTYQVALTALNSSAATIKGLPLTGANLTAVKITNKGVVEIDADTASEEVVVGKSVKLAGFKLEETSKKEDVVVKSVTFTVSGSIDAEEDLSDLVLFADGKEVAANLFVNSDDEIVADLDYTIAADDQVKFELKGTVTGSIGEDIEIVFDDADDVYVVGKNSGVSLAIASVTTTNIANAKEIEGSEINVSFDKSDVDEARPNAEGVKIGTVKLTAASEYTVDELNVTVTSATGVANIVKTLELAGSAYDSVDAGTTTKVYTFKDITLSAGQTLSLPLTMDVKDNVALNGQDVTFNVKIAKVTDEENDQTYSTVSELATVLSSNSFTTKTIDITSASFTLDQTAVSTKELVLANGIEVVMYKGKISVGDADSVMINDMNFAATISTGAFDMQDVVDSAVLNIAGKTYTASVQADGLDFTSISHKVDAGADNVEFTVTVKLKDNDSVSNGDTMKLAVTTGELDLEDSDGESVQNIDVNPVSNTNVVTLNENGTFNFAVIANGDYKDEVKSTVLAGASSVALAEIKYEAENEDVKVKELSLYATGINLTSTLKNVKLINASTKAVIVDAATVTYNGTGTVVTFKNDFVVADASNEVKALLVADLEKYTDKGGETSAVTGDIAFEFKAIDTTWVSSNEDLTETFAGNATAETVTVVPALVTVSIVDEMGTNDKDAVIKFTVDKGTNEFTDDNIYFTGMTLESAVASGVTIRNDDDAAINLTGAATQNITVANTLVDTEILNNDEFTIKVENDGDEVRIVAKGIKYTIGAGSTVYSIVNDKVINLGEYNND